MYNFRLKAAGALLVLTCLMTSPSFCEPPANKATQATPPKPPLPVNEFKQKVAQLDGETQSKLDSTIAKLLGSSQSKTAGTGMPPPKPAAISSESQSPASSSESMTPSTTPSSSSEGFNPYAN